MEGGTEYAAGAEAGVLNQNSSHTAGASVGIPRRKTLSDLKDFTFQLLHVSACVMSRKIESYLLMPVVWLIHIKDEFILASQQWVT